MNWQEIVLGACFFFSFITLGLVDYELEWLEKSERFSVSALVRTAWEGVVCFILSVVSLLYLAFGIDVFPLITSFTKIIVSVVILGMMLLFSWNSIETLWLVRQEKQKLQVS